MKIMLRLAAILAAAIIVASPAVAQKVSTLPAAGTASGTDTVIAQQPSLCATAPCSAVLMTLDQLVGYSLATGKFQPTDADLSAIAALSSSATTRATTALGLSLLTLPDAPTGRSILGAAASGANTDITSITGSAAKWTTGRTVTASGDVGWTFSTDGSANVTATTTLASTGVTAGSYGGALLIPTLTIDGKGRVTTASTVALGTVPIGQGGTGATTASAGLTALGGQPVAANLTALSGLSTSADQCGYWTGSATAALYGCTSYGRSLVGTASAAAAQSLLGLAAVAASGLDTDLTGVAWTAYTPTLSCGSGNFTSASATGRYKRVGKTTFVAVHVTITTNGSCAAAILVGLPVAVVSTGTANDIWQLAGREVGGSYRMLQGVAEQGKSTATVVLYNNGYAGADGVQLAVSGSYEGA